MATVVHGAALRGHRPAPGRAVAVAAPTGLVALVVGTVAALAVDHRATLDGAITGLLLLSWVASLAFGALGWLVARRRPGNRLAVVATGISWGFGIATLLDRYAALADPRGWPAVTWALWAAQWSFVPALWSIPTVLALRFPDGRLAGPRWRWAERLALSGVVVGAVGWALAPYGRLDGAPALPLTNPVESAGGVPTFAVGATAWAVATVACLVGAAIRAWRASGVERAQLQWGVLGTVATVVVVAAGAVTGAEVVSSVGIAILPAAIGVAVLRHGLWDVEVVLHRSVVYGLLTAAILAVYAGTVALLGGALGRSVGAPLLATGLVAVGAEPLHERLQRVAGRLVYGDRGDPYAALARLGDRLDALGDRGAVLSGVAEAVVRALRLRGAAITVDDRTVAAHGDVGPRPLAVPLAVGGEPLGTLLVGLAEGDQLRAADRRLLADLARHVAAAVRAERLQAELEASRARLVTAREEERRRIRRDLHDELGPTLAAIAIEVERASLEVVRSPAEASGRLEDVARRVRATVGEVRALVEGLRPSTLDELGLEGAVRELARTLGRGALDVRVVAAGQLDRLPAAVDVAAYRIVAEALTNAVRHAGARRATVALQRAGGELHVTVVDDGRGFDDGDRRGLGLRSMAERAAELGGVLEVDGRTGTGTTVRAVLPVVAL